MHGDAVSTTSSSLPPRAAVALLTLRLRAAQQDALAAEAATAMVDVDAACDQLRHRLEALIEERRRTMTIELERLRAEAAHAVAAAREDALPAVKTVSEPASPSVVSAPGASLPAASPPPASLPAASVEQLVATLADPPVVDLPVAPVRIDPPSLPISQAGPGATVVIDADAFARVFATVLARLLDERGPSNGMHAAQPVQGDARQQRDSFWTHARHPDILLLSLTMLIVIVVLAAWLV